MKQAENSGRGVMINMNNKRRLCREGVGASMVDGTRPEPTVWGWAKPRSDGDTLDFNQPLCNVASVGDLSLRCFGVTRRKDSDSDGQAANTEQACNKLLILIYY